MIYIYKHVGGRNVFSLKKNTATNTLFVVDEASMIGDNSYMDKKSLLDDLMEYVFTGKKCAVLFVGDTAQLPPVGEELSRALDPSFLESNYYVDVFQYRLTEVVRQTKESGILFNATLIRDKILGKEYAQFARFEGNIVQHNKIGNHSAFVSRFNAGIVIPYGNSRVAPYFQQFFVGGANSMRAFRLRALGPGTYRSENVTSNSFFDQSGDIKIEANVEYRFDLYKWVKWAFFVDAGNVWGLREDPDRSGGVFKSDFYKSIAVGGGMGLRFDFDYFVIRTDIAIPFFDPRKDEGDRFRLNTRSFRISNWSGNNVVFNLAIGYPF